MEVHEDMLESALCFVARIMQQLDFFLWFLFPPLLYHSLLANGVRNRNGGNREIGGKGSPDV